MKTVIIELKRPGLLERAWRRRLKTSPAFLTGYTGPWDHQLARLLPYKWRRVHRAYARLAGFFWLPCPLCGREFGGHEFGDDVPDPMKGPGHGLAICSQCTRARNEKLPEAVS